MPPMPRLPWEGEDADRVEAPRVTAEPDDARSGHLHSEQPGNPPRARRVLLIGADQPVGSAIAAGLADAGHSVALQQGETTDLAESGGLAHPTRILLTADRADAEAMTRLVTDAEQALGGLDALVIMPGRRPAGPSMSCPPGQWADLWSDTLGSDLLAAACAVHAAARMFLSQHRSGQIVLVTGGNSAQRGGGVLANAVDAALASLGSDLGAELGPQGVTVSVVHPRPGVSERDAGLQIAASIIWLLTSPGLPGMAVRLGG